MGAYLLLHFPSKEEMEAFLALPARIQRIEQAMTTFSQSSADMHAAVQTMIAQAQTTGELITSLNQQAAAKDAQIAQLKANQADQSLIDQEEADSQALKTAASALSAFNPPANTTTGSNTSGGSSG